MTNTHPILAGKAALLTLLCGGVAVAALPRPAGTADAEQLQWQALHIAPLSAGGRTGLRMVATPAVEPIEFAPDRPTVALAMTLGTRDSMQSLLARAGAAYGDAGTAASLIASAGRRIAPGTRVSVVLGAKSGARRRVEQVELRADLGMTLQIIRDGGGALKLIERPVPVDTTPLRVRGRVGDGLYWSLRAAGVTPQSAAEYLQALGGEIDVGSEIAANDRFDLVIASRRAATGERETGQLLYAGIDRAAARDLQLVKWRARGRTAWIDAADIGRPPAAGMMWPVAGRITSGFGYRVHPILRFARMHRGVDFGAGWGSPIVAAADGQVFAAGWAGGYGRQVRIAHAGGLATSYSHMSQIVAEPGSFVRAGQLIGYVGSSGLSTGPHLHYEVYRGGVAVNPLSVRFTGAPAVDHAQVAAFKARLKALLSVGAKRG